MRLLLLFFILILSACSGNQDNEPDIKVDADSTQTRAKANLSSSDSQQIEPGNTSPQDLVTFSKTLIGTPYKYGSTDPTVGFDCSGFITFVFNHFGIQVPRTSIGFTNVEHKIDLRNAKPGDIILFTGTDSTIREVGHMGIITSVTNSIIQFIHSSSGKANGVTITNLGSYYLGRFVKVIRVFKQNNSN